MKQKLWFIWILVTIFGITGCSDDEKTTSVELTLNTLELSLKEGEQFQLIATTTPSDAAVSWSTTDAATATVSEQGLVTALKAGAATITAQSGNAKAQCEVQVTKVESNARPIVMNTIGMTQFDNSGATDNFLMMIASGTVVFDEENNMYRTEKEGYVWLVSLFANKVEDPTSPKLPAGSYKLSDGNSAGTWNNEAGTNQLIYYSPETGIRIYTPTTGVIDITAQEAVYNLTANVSCDDSAEYAISYQGEINFEGIATDNKLSEPVNATFIGGQAIYKGADSFFSEYGVVQLELYDAKPDPELGTVKGNFVKCKLYIDLQTEEFKLPAGTWELGFGAAPFVAEPGYDDGENIPTGSYIAQTTDASMLLGMLDSGTITITEEKHVVLDTYTAEGVRVQGRLDIPLEITDLGGGEVPSGQISTLKEDKVLDFSGVSSAYFLDYGDYFENGTRNVVLQVLDTQNMSGMLLDLILPPAEKQFDPIPDSECKLNDGSNAANSFIPGDILNNNAIGTWGFLKLVQSDGKTVPDFSEAGNAAGGSVKITRNGENYTITVDFIDDAETPHTMKGSWTGKLEPYSYNAPQAHQAVPHKSWKAPWLVNLK